MPTTVATALPLWQAGVLLIPVAAASAAALRARIIARRDPDRAWRTARWATGAFVAAAVAAAIAQMAGGDRAGALLRSDGLGVTVLVLVSVVAWVVVRFSARYMQGDPHEGRYVTRLLATLAAVATVLIANDLVVLTGAWAATSLALHGLLTFFADRPVAVAVAHKKFVLARFADLAMFGAVVAFAGAFDTLRLDRMTDAATSGALPAAARVGVALVALAAVLKCAQLPFHGWLIQVMEAPTPVSALLHAGVVNLGGFVLLRIARLVDLAPETRMALVAWGTATAVVAALVMTTRISIKVSLAWSTGAQMGFMLLQCGLGAWEMALAHLVCHSLYKAHAFLGAGGVVRRTQRAGLIAAPAPAPLATTVWAVAAAVGTTAAVAVLWERLPGTAAPTPTLVLLGGIVALALTSLVPAGTRSSRSGAAVMTWRTVGASVLPLAAVPAAYLATHELAGRLVAPGPQPPAVALILVAVAFALLFAVQQLIARTPDRGLAVRLYPWIYGGLFLDEVFTRLVFALWRPPAPRWRAESLPRPSALAPASSTISPSTVSSPTVSSLDPPPAEGRHDRSLA